MLTYSFDDPKGKSLYEQLYDCIREDIIKGILKPDEHLPSKRAFAKHLNISNITVETAYGQLMSEGYIYSRPRKGFYVTDLTANHKYPSSIRVIEDENTVMELKKIRESLNKEANFADFTSNQTIPESFPFSTWAKLTRETISGRKEALMTNSPVCGVRELQEAIAEYLNEFRGLHAAPEQIVVGAGTEYLYGLLIQLLGTDKIYALENPGYRKLASIYSSWGVDYKSIGLDKNGLDINALNKSGADIVHITPSHHFPTGITMPVSRRYELLGWASEQKGRYIIEDDYDSEFRMSGRPVPALYSIDVNEKIIYMNTFTKSLASTIRISYMVLPVHLIKLFYERLNFYACTVSTFEQYTLAAFLKQGYFEKHINRMRNYYKKKRNLLLSSFDDSRLSNRAVISEENAGLHFLISIELGGLEAEEYIDRLRKKGIIINNLAFYYTDQDKRTGSDPGARNTFVINYSSITDEKISKAMGFLYEALD